MPVRFRSPALMDIVYIVGSDSEHLRYSLRSLKNIEHDRVWIVGYQPPWTRGVFRIPVTQSLGKFANIRNNYIAACLNEDVSEEFVLFNDDYYVLRKINSMPTLHSGKLSDVAAQLSSRSDGYARRILKTSALLGPEALAYDSIHVPMVFNKSELNSMMEGIPHDCLIRSWYGNKMKVGGEQRNDAKRRISTPREHVDDDFFSTSSISFDKYWPGEFIKSRFPDISQYEKK